MVPREHVNDGGLRTPQATLAAVATLILVTVVINQTSVHWRDNVVDSHLFAYYGWSVAEGATPYLDVWDNKPPGIWWVNAAAFAILGKGTAPELALCTATLAIALGAYALLVRTVYDPSLTVIGAALGGVLLAHLVFEGGANRTEPLVVACEILGVLGYVRWLRFRRTTWLVLAGLAAGAAPLFKQSGLAVGTACALHLAWLQLRRPEENRGGPSIALRPWLVAGAAFACPLVLAAAVLLARGALGAAWFAVGPFNRAYFAIGDATYWRLGDALRVYWPTIQPLWPLALAAAAGALAHLRRTVVEERDDGWRAPVGLFWLWFALALYLACVGPGRRGHHFLPVLPPLGLLALYPLHAFAAHQGLVRRLTARPLLLAAVVAVSYFVVELEVLSLRETARCWSAKRRWYGLSYAEPPGYQRQAAWIRAHSSRDDTLYVWGWSPGTYRYAYRRCPSRFATLEKLGQVGYHAEFVLHGAIRDLRANPPKILVFSESDLAGLRRDPDDAFARWVAGHYADHGHHHGMHMLLRRDSGAISPMD